VRVIAATNRDLDSMMRDRSFREDLYYRLQVIELRIPPLRQRRNEIPALIEFFLLRYAPWVLGGLRQSYRRDRLNVKAE